MPKSIAQTKRRIKTISATRKITKAMELIATSKLKANRAIYDQSSLFTEDIYKMVQICLAHLEDPESRYLTSQSDVTLHIIVTSNLGLCGSYNSNILKLAKATIKKGDKLIIFGEKGAKAFADSEVEILGHFTTLVGFTELELCIKLAEDILNLYDEEIIGKVNYIYTEFVNSLTFTSKSIQLLPVDLNQFAKAKKDKTPLLYEPNVQSILDYILPLYFETLVYGKLIEAHVSEHACRRIAMESATENADDIKEKLMIEYNKARQTAITQEINEVVSGANV